MSEFSTEQRLVVVGGAVTVLGALLPWVGGIGSFDAAGIELIREILALLLGLVVVGLVFVADWTATTQLVTALLGVAVAGVAAYTLAEALELVGSAPASPGLGLYVTLLGGLVLLAAGMQGYTDTEPEAGMYSHR